MLKMDNLLYIGLNGFAGSGKDTVAKMLASILNFNWSSKEDAYNYYKRTYVDNKKMYATLDNSIHENQCMCIAFADQLKKICSVIFGVPVQYFFYNKETSWICINKDFEYTEIRPNSDSIISAEDFYVSSDQYFHSSEKYWMSLREILIYVGTYVCQYDINKCTFVNIVNNCVKEKIQTNDKLKYVICTDVRFVHEYDYIRKKNGIMINIVRDSVNQMDNIAEHELDSFDESNFNYVISNDGTYDELFDSVWNIVMSNIEFKNEIISLKGRDSNNNYLRIIYSSTDKHIYRLCMNNGIAKITHSSDSKVYSINPVGGPEIICDEKIPGTSILVSDIVIDHNNDEYCIIER